MRQYLHDVKFAVETTIQVIWHEYSQIEELEREIRRLESIIAFNMNRVQSLAYSDDDDDYLLAVQGYWDSYFGEQKERYNKDRDLDSLNLSFGSKQFSINSLSSTLLQIAKQGITTVLPSSSLQGSFDRCGNGRMIGSQPLKTVIRQGRNQSMHYDEPGTIQPWLRTCFDSLIQEFGSQFNGYENDNKAFDIVKLLNWRSYAVFEVDMLSLVE